VLIVEQQGKDLRGLIRLMVGFFVSTICQRWWWQFKNIANADYIALLLLGFVEHKEDPNGTREEARLYRRTIVRYINLAIIETLRTVSLRTAKRFRTYDELVASRVLTEEERSIIKDVQGRTTKSVKWLPLTWSIKLLKEMRRKKFIDDKGHEKLLFEIKNVESTNYKLRCLVWVNFPMAYTQVVVLVYMTLVACLLFGSQYIVPLSEQQCKSNSTDVEDLEAVSSDIEHNANIVFHFAQFVFYLGWVTVAKIMLNPFGEDPDDFDTNYVVDRNLQTSLQIVDDNPKDFPSLSDPFHDTIPGDLKQSPCGASMEYKYAEKGPLTVEQLLGDQKLFKDGQSITNNLRRRLGLNSTSGAEQEEREMSGQSGRFRLRAVKSIMM